LAQAPALGGLKIDPYLIKTVILSSTNGGDKECIEDIGGKARRKETTGKTKT
jgi:hypothetical protein